jgi:hypothetical protein
MQPRIITFFVAFMLLGAATAARGFSLLIPTGASSFQTAALGYAVTDPWADIGGPGNIHEEYRWNTPYLTYAFDQSFLNYFGKQGMDAIDQAMAIMNNLPRVSDLSADLSEYPMDNKKVNYTAKAMGVMDLKSMTLPYLLEIMGLAAPERWVYCLYNRATVTTNGTTSTNYFVISRNFDPISFGPTNRVNNAFYGYIIQEGITPGNYADAVEQTIDPLTIVPYSSVAGGYMTLGVGETYPGLTRDDVGGLRYLYRFRHINMENLPSTVGLTNASTNVLTNTVISSTMSNSPWVIYMGTNSSYTNNLITNTFLYTNNPWTIYQGTNATSTNSSVTNATDTNVLMTTGLRPGVEKVTFIKTMYDSYLGQAYTPITNVYKDVVITNFLAVTQTVQRVTTTPDIIFSAYDLGLSTSFKPNIMSRNVAFVNEDAINGTGSTHAGPGELATPVVFNYTDILPGYINSSTSGGALTQTNAVRTLVWGSFGPSMDTPIQIYPNWISLQELENMILGNP